MPKSFRVIMHWLSSFFVFCLFLGLFAFPVTAQTPLTENSVSSFSPNIESNVPKNQHTLAQSVLIEVLSAVQCALIGIDPIHPTRPCLDINPSTGQLGYAPSATTHSEKPVVRGLLGMGASMIGTLYTPTTSTTDYVRYISSNFGIIKHAYAAPANAFEGLQPVIKLWIASRNISYFLLILVLIFIAVGVMLRIRIDPRTVMTIQNQIPRVIIAILLITFSYAIAAIMIDIMWAVTYVGINQISTASNQPIPCNGGQSTVNAEATKGIYQTPIVYVNNVFANTCTSSGIAGITARVSNSIGSLIANLITDLFNPPGGGQCVGWTGIDVNDCFQRGIAIIVGYITSVILSLIIFVAVIISLFRTWFELLKAYIYLFIYVITSPIWFVIGLAPGRPLGVEKWMRGFFVNLAIFPVTAWLYVGGREITDLFASNPQDKFIPPLVGNPAVSDFSGLIAFGVLMMAPTLLSLLRDKMKVPGIKQGAAIGAGLAAGASVVGAPANKAWSHLTRRNPQTGNAEGPLARMGETLGNKVVGGLAKMKIPGAKTAMERREYKQEQGTLTGFKPGTTERKIAGKGYTNDKAGKKQHAIDQQIESLEQKRDATSYGWRKKRFQRKIDNLRAQSKFGPNSPAGQEEARRKAAEPTRPGPGTENPQSGTPQPGTKNPTEGKAEEETTETPKEVKIKLTIHLPGGTQEDIDLGTGAAQQTTHEFVLDKMGLKEGTRVGTEARNFIERERAEAAKDNTTSLWDKKLDELTEEQAELVQNMSQMWSENSESSTEEEQGKEQS